MNYLNIYVQTEYSLLRSAVKLDEYINYAKAKGLKSLAICDDNAYAFYKFYTKCVSQGIKPILGLRLKLAQDDFSLLYAYNHDGYKNLLKLSSMQMLGQSFNLGDYASGLVLVLPYKESKITQDYDGIRLKDQLNEIKNHFSHVYVGLDLIEEKWQEVDDKFKTLGIDTCIINKTLYLEKEDLETYLTLRKIEKLSPLYELSFEERNAYYKDEVILDSVLVKRKHLIDNLRTIEGLCNLNLDFSGYKFPKYNQDDSNEYLVNLAKVGLNKRLKGRQVDLEKYRTRLLYELSVIKDMGFSDYFLIVYDYVKFAKTHGILVGPGRGSGAGSLVSYAIGITNMDPIEYDLLFERFLNPERKTMPDIDIDFPDAKRDEVISYIGQRFGLNKVAHLNAFSTFGARSAIRDVGKVLGIDAKRLSIISSYIPEKNSPKLSVLAKTHTDIAKICASDEDIKKLFELASKIEDMPRNTTTHASGIVIVPSELTNYTAIQKGLSGIYQTQFEASDIEHIGLVKLDILGLKNLTIIDNIFNNIKETRGINLDFYNFPLDDKETLLLLSKGDNDGLFQLESSGMRKTMRDMHIDSFIDIVNCLALYRPGPMDMINDFIARKHGKKYKFIVPALKPILDSTYGICVYQEQVMQIASAIANYSLGEADILRRGVSKKNKEILMQERAKFLARGKENGYSLETLDKLYSDIVKFADYGFNKSHAVVYGYVAYVMGYLKAHFFPEFCCALMDSCFGGEMIDGYISSAKLRGIAVLPPDINKSELKFSYKDGKIYWPLSGIKDVSIDVASKIILEKQKSLFSSYEDFIARTISFLNKKAFSMLAYAGAVDNLGITRKSAIEEYDSTVLRVTFSSTTSTSLKAVEYSNDEYSFSEISDLEKLALGKNLVYDAFIRYNDAYKKYKASKLAEALNGTKLETVIAKITSIKDIVTKKNTNMSFVGLSDSTQDTEATLFSNEYNLFRNKLVEGRVYLFKVEVSERNDEKQLIIKNALDITI